MSAESTAELADACTLNEGLLERLIVNFCPWFVGIGVGLAHCGDLGRPAGAASFARRLLLWRRSTLSSLFAQICKALGILGGTGAQLRVDDIRFIAHGKRHPVDASKIYII